MQWRTLPRRAYGRRGWYTVGLRAALRAGPWAVLRAGSTAGPSGRRTDDADTYQWTSRPRASGAYSRSEPTAVRPGIRLGRLESTHRWTGQPGPRYPLAPARDRSHRLGTRPAQEEWRGPSRDGMGRRRRLQQAEPGRAGTKMWRYRKVSLFTVTPYDPLESYTVSRLPLIRKM